MPKKQKVGKARRDKAYWAAKEIGYRSRASFKLVQLNRKWEFLQKSNVCIDLCAAPGSWMQVAKECMPMSSLVVGIDLAPIKPIPGAICLQGDITSDKTRSDLKRELKTAKADVVLHDGAPNVGKNWINDAYQQSLLTLHAFKLASEFLVKGGWFVTKVFRSKDYQSLMWVFGQFFNKVHATKPAASRNESAEIFVVCQNYQAPDKIDPKFLDPRHVFSEVEPEEKKSKKELINPEKSKRLKNKEGYDDGATVLFKEAKASDFIMGKDAIQILNECNSIVLDTPRVLKHERTTTEIKECLKDLKVLGIKELRLLKKWRDSLKKEFEAIDESNKENAEVTPAVHQKTKEEEEDEEMAIIDKQIEDLRDEERRAARRTKKKELKEKRKIAEKINLKMIIPGDEGPKMVEDGLFKISELKSKADLEKVGDDTQLEELAEDSESDVDEEALRPKHEKYSKEDGVLDSEGLWYGEDDQQGESGSGSDSEDEKEELGMEIEDEGSDKDEEIDEQYTESKNPLIKSLSEDNVEDKKSKKADMWFKKIGNLEDDSDLEEAEIGKAMNIVKKKGAKIRTKEKVEEVIPSAVDGYRSDSDEDDEVGNIHNQPAETDSEDSDSEAEVEHVSASGKHYSKDGFEIVPQKKVKKRKALTPEELALGEQLVKSKKAKRDIMDDGWHRFMFNDTNLPEWFVKEEEFHMKKRPDVDPAVVEKYIEKGKEVNVKTIKKVVEAKARRKRKVAKKMEKAKKRAETILENEDLGSREKASEIKKLYKKAQQAGKSKEVSYVVAKKYNAQKRSKRPAGIKGPYKQVDSRMKKDSTSRRQNAKPGKKRRLKGKQAKPTKQFNTNR